MKRKLLPFVVISVFAFSTTSAAVSDEDFEQLRKQLAAVSQKLDELAAENEELRRSQAQTATTVADVQSSVAAASKAAPAASGDSWTDRISLDGDFRYRYENIDVEGSDERNRNRIRARTNVRAAVADDIEVGFGLATGGDDPVSANQTLGGGGSSKNVVINLAYVDWEATDGLHLLAGKFKNPLMRAGKQQLLWDGDWTPEGVAVTYKRDWFFTNALGTYLEGDSRRSNFDFSWGAQIGVSGELGGAKVKGGVGYYEIKTAGETTTFGDPGDPGDYSGNTAVEAGGLPCGTTVGATCNYLYDYLLTEVFAEAEFDVGDWPAQVYMNWVNNSDPSDNDTGWTVGARVGQTKDRGEMQFSYLYAEKEADSVIGLLTDSNFGGGGTDSKGHFLEAKYAMSKNWTIGARYFINETDISTGSNNDYNRLILDTQWNWK